MARTERAVSPRALIKDRSVSKSGKDKAMQKHGAGAHNWGGPVDTLEGEYYDALDEDLPPSADAEIPSVEAINTRNAARRESVSTAASSSPSSEEDKAQAMAIRTKAFKDGSIDLGSIARSSSAVCTSPTK